MIYYTYHICWSNTDIHYYGVRGTNSTPEEDFWKQYFTSSKYVKQYRLDNGEPDIIQIRRVFGDNRSAALKWERTVLTRLNVVKSTHWLNRYTGSYHGAPGPKNHGWKISKMTKGRKKPADVVDKINRNPEKIRKTALAHTGMKRSDNAKRLMSDTRKQFLADIGGAQNKGMKMYYNPENHNETIQCLPEYAPLGWINGNPKKKGKRPYINDTQEIKWWHPADVDTNIWHEWNANKDTRV